MSKAYFISTYHEIYDETNWQPMPNWQGLRLLHMAAGYWRAALPMTPRNTARKCGQYCWNLILVEAAQAAYDSDGYKAALDALGDGVKRDIRIIEGV